MHFNHHLTKLFPYLLLILLLVCSAPPKTRAASLAGAVDGLSVGQISSFQEMQTALNLLASCCREAKQKGTFTFSLQKIILSKSGECISRIVELEQQTDQQKKREEAKSLFSENRKLIKDILDWNQATVLDMQENRLDQMEDEAAFFTSPEWQHPHHLISLASYWLSWNNYYRCLLVPADDPSRKDLLEESVEGFSRTGIDFKEDAIVVRSFFGRALCYKEMQQYDRAIRDINGVIGRIKRDDILYQRSRYEKVLISYLTGNYESVLRQLQDLRDEVGDKNISPPLDTELKKLRVKTIIALSEKESGTGGAPTRRYHLDALNELKALVAGDERQAGELYRYVNERAAALADLPYDVLGPIGSLSVADWYFNRQEYDRALLHYQRLSSSAPSPLIAEKMDDVYLKSGYCFITDKQWASALSCFESLFTRFPRSALTDKAACLNYSAAANHYKEKREESAYDTYIDAAKRYLKHCSEQVNKSDVHFQLGKYYQDRGRGKEAVKEFSSVGKDSPHYAEARYAVLQSAVDELASSKKTGHRETGVNMLYREALKQLDEYRALLQQQGTATDTKELEGQVRLLQAKAYSSGPAEDCKKALHTLEHFEETVPRNERLAMMAKGLRIECYQKLGRVKEAQEEIDTVFNQGRLDADRWALLHELAALFYEESKRLRKSGNSARAGEQAEIALSLYQRLSAASLTTGAYEGFFDSIQLRMAEIYSDENQAAAAKAVYREQLQRDPSSADALYNLGLLHEREESWDEALALWRRFSQGLKTGSHYWFESRYHMAKALHHLGESDRACEITTMIEVLHPGLRDGEFKAKFTVLHEEVCADQEVR